MNQQRLVQAIPVIFISVFFMVTSCNKEEECLNSLINLIEEPPGINCSSGGIKIETGIDSNRNGQLGIDEVQQTEFVCNGGEGSLIIKEMRFRVVNLSISAFDAVGRIYPSELLKFNIANYSNVDSVLFVVEGASTSQRGVNFIVELYDKTNDRVIENSEVKTSDGAVVRLISRNLVSNFPEEEIDLAVKCRMDALGANIEGSAKGAYLFLYFKAK